MYPDSLAAQLDLIEATREQRQAMAFPPMTAEDKVALLRKYHPDYKAAAFRELRIGANKGDRTTHEFADLLEAFSSRDQAGVALEPEVTTDVLVLGGGGAGVTAALFAEGQGARVLLATKLRLGNSNTIMALGGMQAALAEQDSPIRHFADTMIAGGFAGNRQLVKSMVEDGPPIVAWLLRIGVNFDRDANGNLATRTAAGMSAPRLLSIGDHTGLNIMKCLRDELRKSSRVELAEFSPAVELTTDQAGACNGALLYDLGRRRYFAVRARAVILATGGAGRLHNQGFPTSNNFGATGDAIVMAYRAGARMVELDSFQYHPTGVMFPEHMVGVLVTEAIRGLGANLVNAQGDRFVNELETRDVVASAIIRECETGNGIRTPAGKIGVWLDIPLLEELFEKGLLRKRFPALFKKFMRVGINIARRPLLVYPTLHYQNGGILIDESGESTVKNLFVAGEAAGGIHGRNRAMGNALLDIFVFGRRAGIAAAGRRGEKLRKLTLNHIADYYGCLKALRITSVAKAPTLFPEFIVDKL